MATLEVVSFKGKGAGRRSIHPRLWTAEQFLDWLQPGVHADLIGGQKFMHSPVNLRHAVLLNTVDRVLGSYVAQKQLGCLCRETIAVRFAERDVFLPDLSYFKREQVTRLQPGDAPFAPTLVVEALSKRTAKRDTGVKFAAYERYGVQEYWILDPIEGEHRFYTRQSNLFVESAQAGNRIDCQSVPGFYLRREWLDPINPPTPLDCLHELLAME